MKRSPPPMVAAALLAFVAVAACSTATRAPAPEGVRSGTDGAATAQPGAPANVEGAPRRYSEADAQLMQRMIGHHAQALAMTGLVPARSKRDDIRLLAERIDVSQQGEITSMRRWLTDRGAAAPSAEAGHEHHAMHAAGGGQPAPMPGMLTPEELAQLAKATGADFDRLFLQFMIRHHEGALTMVAQYLATPGAGQDAEAFRLASDVDADQRAEISRMRAMLSPR